MPLIAHHAADLDLDMHRDKLITINRIGEHACTSKVFVDPFYVKITMDYFIDTEMKCTVIEYVCWITEFDFYKERVSVDGPQPTFNQLTRRAALKMMDKARKLLEDCLVG